MAEFARILPAGLLLLVDPESNSREQGLAGGEAHRLLRFEVPRLIAADGAFLEDSSA